MTANNLYPYSPYINIVFWLIEHNTHAYLEDLHR